MKASNKYLFNKSVDCQNCIYSFNDYYQNNLNTNKSIHSRLETYCSLNTMIKEWLDLWSHYPASYIRGASVYHYFNCGPLGKFYEPR